MHGYVAKYVQISGGKGLKVKVVTPWMFMKKASVFRAGGKGGVVVG